MTKWLEVFYWKVRLIEFDGALYGVTVRGKFSKCLRVKFIFGMIPLKNWRLNILDIFYCNWHFLDHFGRWYQHYQGPPSKTIQLQEIKDSKKRKLHTKKNGLVIWFKESRKLSLLASFTKNFMFFSAWLLVLLYTYFAHAAFS